MNNIIGILTWEACETCKSNTPNNGCRYNDIRWESNLTFHGDDVACELYEWESDPHPDVTLLTPADVLEVKEHLKGQIVLPESKEMFDHFIAQCEKTTQMLARTGWAYGDMGEEHDVDDELGLEEGLAEITD